MTDASPASLASVSVGITTDLSPLQAKLDQAQALLVAWDAKMASLMSSSGAGTSAALAKVNTSAAETAAVLNTVTAPAAAATAKIDALGASATDVSVRIGKSAISSAELAKMMAGTGTAAQSLRTAIAEVAASTTAATVATKAFTDAQMAAFQVQARAAAAQAGLNAGYGIGAVPKSAEQSAAAFGALLPPLPVAPINEATGAVGKLNTALRDTENFSAGVSREFTVLGAEIARGNISRIPSSLLVLNERLASTGTSVLTLKNGMAALGALGSVVFNPFVLGFLAITLGLDAAVHGFEALAGSGKSAAEALKANDDYLKSISQVMPDVARSARAYADALSAPASSNNVLAYQGGQTLKDLQDQLDRSKTALTSFLRTAEAAPGVGADIALKYRAADQAFGDLSGSIRKALTDFQSGSLTAAGFANRLAEISLSPNLTPQASSIVKQLEDGALAAAKLEAGVNADKKALAELNSPNQAIAAQFQGFQSYLKTPVAALQQQIDMVGKGSVAIAAAKAETDVWSNANITASTDLQRLAYAAGQAGAQVGTLTAALAAAQAHSDLTFNLSLIGLSPIQQQVASQLRGKFGDNAAANLNTPTGQDLTLSTELSKFNALTQHVPTKTEAAQLFDNITKSGKLTADQIASVTSQYKGWLATLATAHGGHGQNAFDSTFASITKQTDALKAQIATFGQSTSATESAKVAQQLLDAAIQDHIKLTPALRQAIQDAADKYGAAKQQLDEMTKAQRAAQEQMRQWRDAAISASETFASTFISDLRQGSTAFQSFADAASQALDQIAQKLIDMAIENLWSNAFGGSSGGGGIFGFLGGLFGGGATLAPGAGLNWASAAFPAFASGTSSAPGGLSLVGERGPEIVSLPSGSQVFNATRTAAMFNAAANSSSNDNGLTIHVNVDARGAQQGAGAEIATALTSFARNQLPTLIRQYNANPNRRGYVPYPAGA